MTDFTMLLIYIWQTELQNMPLPYTRPQSQRFVASVTIIRWLRMLPVCYCAPVPATEFSEQQRVDWMLLGVCTQTYIHRLYVCICIYCNKLSSIRFVFEIEN